MTPLWRADIVGYDEFAEYLVMSRGLPTWSPWPLPPGWAVTDFGCVGAEGRPPTATALSLRGHTEVDGEMSLTVVTEEPGVGLGARIADVTHTDPGREALGAPSQTKVRVGTASVPLWTVPTAPGVDSPGAVHDPLDRSVLAGEAHGRWLWLVVGPATAALGLAPLGTFTDLSAMGPELLAVPFAEGPREW